MKKTLQFLQNDQAEWLGNDNRKTMIKATTTAQILPSKSGTALPSPSQAPGSAFSDGLPQNSEYNFLAHSGQIL